MRKLSDYLDDAKKITGSDGKTGELLGVSRQAVSNYRKRQSMSTEHAAILAEILDIDFKSIIAACEVGRDPSKWEFWSKRVAAIAILSVGLVGFSSFNSKAYAESTYDINYILCAYVDSCQGENGRLIFLRLMRVNTPIPRQS